MTEASNSSFPKSVQPGIPKRQEPPAGWKVMKLRQLLKPVMRPVAMKDDETYQLVKAKRSRGGIVARERLKGREILTKTQFEVRAGDFLISRRQISHGACGLVPPELDGALVSNEYLALRPTEKLDLGYLIHLSHSVYFQQTCFHSSIGVHVEKLVFKPEVWLDWSFNIPPIDEQRRIAAVLDAWDEGIMNLESLADLKAGRYRGLAAELFANEPQRPLLDLYEVMFSGVDKKTAKDERAVLLCNYMDVVNHRQIRRSLEFMEATASPREIASMGLRVGDVLFTKDSETAEDIAEAAVVAEDLPGVLCGYHLGIARPRSDRTNGFYLAHALRVPAIRNEFVKRTNGVVRFGLTLDALSEIQVPAPSPEKQRAVAGALDGLIVEERSLWSEVALLRRQKRGLMQKLLTGEWRAPASIDRPMPGGAKAERLAKAVS